jgi:hypothetical protein
VAIAAHRGYVLTRYRVDNDWRRVRLQCPFVDQASQGVRLGNIVCLEGQTTPRDISHGIPHKPATRFENDQN